MDKLTAYKILGIDETASEREIKRAYARLSKEYHPEEHPEEFQAIREAYVCLTRKNKEPFTASASTPETLLNKRAPSTEKPFQAEHTLTLEDPSPDLADASSNTLDFEQKLQEDQKAIQQCIDKINALISSKNRYNTDAFVSIFQKYGSDEVLFAPEFMNALAAILCKTKLGDTITQYIYNLYKKRASQAQQQSEEYQVLENILRFHITADKKDRNALPVLALAFLLGEIMLHFICYDSFLSPSVSLFAIILYYSVFACINAGMIFYFFKLYPLSITELISSFVSLVLGLLFLFFPIWGTVFQDMETAKIFAFFTLVISGIKCLISLFLFFLNPYFYEDLERSERRQELAEERKRIEILLQNPDKIYSEDLQNIIPKVDFTISNKQVALWTGCGWCLVCIACFLFEYLETGQILLPFKSILFGGFCGVVLLLLQQIMHKFTTLLQSTIDAIITTLLLIMVILATSDQCSLPFLGIVSEYFLLYLFILGTFPGVIVIVLLLRWESKQKDKIIGKL